jgi:hypothetical protein
MNKKQITVGIILLLLFAELSIDFAIGFGDTGLVGLLFMATLAVSGISMLIAFAKKKKVKGIGWAIIFFATILGSILGGRVTSAQLVNSQAYVEMIAIELNEIKEETGSYPSELSVLEGYDESGRVPLGIFRKRPLFYSLNEDSESSRLWFPYIAFMIAEYDSTTHEWDIYD